MMDQSGKEAIEGLFKGLEFLEVQGLNLNGENKLNILITPVISPVTPAFATHISTAPSFEKKMEEETMENNISI